MLNTFRSKVDEANKKKNALAAIVEAKKGALKWRQYCASKRTITKSSKFDLVRLCVKISGIMSMTNATNELKTNGN